MTTTSLLSKSSNQESIKPIYQEAKSCIAETTFHRESFQDWDDILEELSNPEIVRDVIKARKEFRTGKGIPYDKVLKLSKLK